MSQQETPMRAADIMTHQVLAVDPEAPLVQAIRLMTQHKVSGLPVVSSDGRIVGILTEGDLLRRVETGTEGKQAGWLTNLLLPGRIADNYVTTHARRVNEVMTSEVITISEDTPLQEVVALMQRHHVKRLPVIRDGKLVGVVSRADLVRRVGDTLLASPAVSADDDAIRQTVLAAMEREPWARGNTVSVSVLDGVVELDGCLFSIPERAAMGVLAENVPGVTRVENRIICVEPYSGMVTYGPAA
jgi:CBS domain-containing protein